MWAIFYVKWGGQKSLYALWELNKTWAKRLSEPKYVHIPYTLEGMVARLGWDLIWMFPFATMFCQGVSSQNPDSKTSSWYNLALISESASYSGTGQSYHMLLTGNYVCNLCWQLIHDCWWQVWTPTVSMRSDLELWINMVGVNSVNLSFSPLPVSSTLFH